MALPQAVLDFLNETAESAGSKRPGSTDDLFKSGVLDSFSLIDLVTVLSEQCAITVPDSDVLPSNFQTIDAIERYVHAKQG